PISSKRKNCNSKASLLKMRKTAPFQVLFCGMLQTFAPPGIDSACRNSYLTRLIIMMREINRNRKSQS
ncbi:hypothetical protein NE699_26225, partial [Escherichia coli]|uniref:hypothetical protein n=1 Tax=Escherichia coli TaxID=562 RepID=UPI00210D22D2